MKNNTKQYALALLLVISVAGLHASGSGETAAQSDLTTVESWPFESGGSLILEAHTGGNIRVESWDRDAVELTITKRGNHPELITVNTQATERRVRSVVRQSRNARGLSVEMVARVPAATSIEISSTGGNLVITGITGEATATTMGGNIIVRNSALQGRLSTMGGNLDFTGTNGTFKATTMGGNIDFDGAGENSATQTAPGSDRVTLETMGGNITVKNAPLNIELKTMGGNINLGLIEGSLKATTMGGNISLKTVNGETELSTLGGNITVGNAASRLRATTSGGNITIEKSGPETRVTTKGGNITVRETRGALEASSEGGDLDITLSGGLAYDADITLYQSKRARRDFQIISTMNMQRFEESVPERSTLKRILRANAVQGAADVRVTLSTVDGDIKLAQR